MMDEKIMPRSFMLAFGTEIGKVQLPTQVPDPPLRFAECSAADEPSKLSRIPRLQYRENQLSIFVSLKVRRWSPCLKLSMEISAVSFTWCLLLLRLTFKVQCKTNLGVLRQ